MGISQQQNALRFVVRVSCFTDSAPFKLGMKTNKNRKNLKKQHSIAILVGFAIHRGKSDQVKKRESEDSLFSSVVGNSISNSFKRFEWIVTSNLLLCF